MSVHINPKGELVITFRCITDPGADLLDIKRSIISLVQNRAQDELPTFAEYRILELLKELEFSQEQTGRMLQKQ